MKGWSIPIGTDHLEEVAHMIPVSEAHRAGASTAQGALRQPQYAALRQRPLVTGGSPVNFTGLRYIGRNQSCQQAPVGITQRNRVGPQLGEYGPAAIAA